ncbi:MAG: hypothetical protein QF864_15445, partial [SAR202 cluster bacterium]|nr:hypothetical protein [SAR202 cluster bacterium]
MNFIRFIFPLHYFYFNESRSILEILGRAGFQHRFPHRFIRHREGTSTDARAASAGSCELLK